ncbi:MAG: hypothetical protein M3Z03_15585 [Actinomycetota bacterium]|nr:hypothetical protein [Actinomycetota bacterium]
MRFEFGALPWEMLGKRPVMITLTYPGEWEVWVPNARVLAKHREAFRARWERRYGPVIGAWVTEFQKRGAPHLHLYVALPDSVSEDEYKGLQQRTINRRLTERNYGSYEARKRLRAPRGDFAMWLRTAWWQVVGSELKAHHGRGVDIATAFYSDQAESMANRARVAEYFWRESGKWAQKNPPDGFGSLKFYGRWGGKRGFNPVVTEAQLSDTAGYEIRRVLRRMQLGKMREAAKRTGRRVHRHAGRSRGRDGLTVFNVDGRSQGPRLLDWAERTVMLKAGWPTPEETGGFRRFDRAMLRMFPEIPIDTEGPPEPWDDVEFPEWIDPEDALHDAYVAHLERERAIDDHLEALAHREWRKAVLREQDRRRYAQRKG